MIFKSFSGAFKCSYLFHYSKTHLMNRQVISVFFKFEGFTFIQECTFDEFAVFPAPMSEIPISASSLSRYSVKRFPNFGVDILLILS